MPAPAEEAIRAVSALATQLGNQISVHMLNYLSTTKDLPSGFRELSHTFLDTCRTLWAIEAGVTELSAANRALPEVIITEVEKKFVAAYADFQQLEKLILKLVQYEHRGTWGKLQRGFHRPNHELHRIHDSLKKTNETLQISGMAFHWSLGEARPEESVGIGYASLAAALDRIAKGRSAMAIDKLNPIDLDKGRSSPSQMQSSNSLRSSNSSPSVPQKDSVSFPNRSRYVPTGESHERHSQEDPQSLADDMSSILSLNGFLVSGREGERFGSIDHRPAPPRTTSKSPLTTTSVSEVYTRQTNESSAALSSPIQSGRGVMDSYPSAQFDGHTPRNSLSFAIRGRNHARLEQLLNSGVSPDRNDHIHPLVEAVSQRDMESMRLLLFYKADPDIPNSQGKTPLLLAVEQSFLDEAILLLKFGADANFRSDAGQESPLFCAVANKNIELTETLLAHGGNPNQETRSETTLLIQSIRDHAPAKLVEILLGARCDSNHKDTHGKTALCEAVQRNQPEIVTTLLNHGANPNLPGPEHALWSAVYRPDCLRVLLARGADIHKTPGLMEQATSVNNIDAVRVLLQAGVSPNLKKDGIYTPLCSAIRDDRADIITLLLKHNADPNLMASEYPAWKCITHNQLHFLPDLLTAGADLRNPPGIAECAVAHNNNKALTWLVEHGNANLNDRNEHGHTALTTAIRENLPETLKWLLAHGADANLRGQDWPIYMATKSPALLRLLLPSITNLAAHKGVVEKAVQANQLESIKLLLAAGASAEWKNGGVFSPLTTALRERYTDIVTFLLEDANNGGGGADPNAPGEHLPLVKAIRRAPEDGNFSMIELLLEKGADPNKCYRDWNALMQAIENRDLRLLKLLIGKGGPVDFSQKDDAGRNVLEMAETEGWAEGVRVLEEGSK
ncbi:ankyrin [Aspergillus pseudoustus]|uniref:Ankyrin n=1 Tax=Aspergillus pseudoustus TaxID=1810923 RepID=A0ABR4K1Y2_9EURO